MASQIALTMASRRHRRDTQDTGHRRDTQEGHTGGTHRRHRTSIDFFKTKKAVIYSYAWDRKLSQVVNVVSHAYCSLH